MPIFFNEEDTNIYSWSKRKTTTFALITVCFLGSGGIALADSIGIGDFISPTILNFNDAPDGLIDSFYSGLTFVSLYGGSFGDTSTGEGVSETASNFLPTPEPPFLAGEILFDTPVTRAGFFITTNTEDDTTVSAYMGTTFVGSHLFDTGGFGFSGSFAGIEFLYGFDRIAIDPADIINGAFSIDNFRYEGTPIPDYLPSTAWHGIGRIEISRISAQEEIGHSPLLLVFTKRAALRGGLFVYGTPSEAAKTDAA